MQFEQSTLSTLNLVTHLKCEKWNMVFTDFKNFWPFGCFFLGGSPTLIWPREGSNYPSRSCNDFDGPTGPKLKKTNYRFV